MVGPMEIPEETLLVHVEPDRGECFLVYVLDDVAALQAFVRDVLQDADPDVAKLSGCCYGITSTTDPNIVGAVVLAKTKLGAGYVAHEMGHAAFRAIERLGLQVNHDREDASFTVRASSVEERYCGIVEHLNAGFWREAYRLGLAGNGGATGRPPPSPEVDALTGKGLAGGGPPDGDVHAPPDA